MNLRSLALALVAGIATFLVVGIAVTALAEPRIEFSVFLGIPAGLVAGAVAAAVVAFGLGDDAAEDTHRIAFAFGLFGAGFIVSLVVTTIAGQGIVLSIAVGVAVGLVAAAVGYFRGPKLPPAVTA